MRPAGGAAWVISDLDIYRAAHVLIKRHGSIAPTLAAMQVDRFAATGDMNGRAILIRVLKAVEEVLDRNPPKKGQLVR